MILFFLPEDHIIHGKKKKHCIDQKKLKITLNSETNHRKYHIKQYLNSHTINIYAQFFRFCQTECKEIKAYADQTDSCHQIYT